MRDRGSYSPDSTVVGFGLDPGTSASLPLSLRRHLTHDAPTTALSSAREDFTDRRVHLAGFMN